MATLQTPTPETSGFLFGHKDMAKQEARQEDFRPMTMTEIHERIRRAEDDFAAGRVISQEDLEKEILTWR
jgi:hypothetical protein